MATVIQGGKMSAPGQGGLFQNQIFWLSHRVPQRSHIITQIRANGGSVVLGEKDAEVCLVDHMRDEGEGMFSYEYVTKSLKMEKLQDLELYRVMPKRKKGTRSTTLVPSSARPRGRNLFTQEEDDILLEALSEPGVKIFGNTVYQKLADKYPRHTMHSWRGRWVDHLCKTMPVSIPPGKKPVENRNRGQREESVEQIRIKREGEEFTEQEEAVLEKWAELIAINPHEISIYERLGKVFPQHTPQQWRAHFIHVILPRLKKKVPQKSTTNSKQSVAEPDDHPQDSDNEQRPAASSSKDRAPPGSKQEVKIKTVPKTDLKYKKRPFASDKTPPVRVIDIRNPPSGAPSSTGKDRNQPSTSHQRRKVTPSSPSYQSTTPIVPSKASLSTTPLSTMRNEKLADCIPRWRAEVYRAPVAKDTDADLVPPSSPPQPPSNPPPTTQKRKRDSNATLERKKLRNVNRNMGEVTYMPEPGLESPSRPHVLSPELMSSDAHYHPPASSPPIPKVIKLKYAEMSTQAIYDQPDDDPFLEFPEIEIPSTSPSPPPHPIPSLSPRFPTQRNPLTPTKLLAPTPDSAAKFTPLSPTKDDPDGIKDMNTFLDYCQKKYKISEKQVINAVERASGIKKLVELVLQCVANNKPLPTDVPGVWSEDEDRVLMGADSREMMKLQERKGATNMEKRMDFLNLWNMA